MSYSPKERERVSGKLFPIKDLWMILVSGKLSKCSYTVPFKSKLTVRCESRFSTRFAILDSCSNQESRIENKLSRIESRRTENKRFTHDWFLDNFSKTYSCNTTRHGYIHASDCMFETRPIQFIKRMFLQGHLYQASFPQLKFQIPAPNANKQCITRVQATACVFCNINSGLIWPLGLILKDQL